MDNFVSKFVAVIFTKKPNLVTLLALLSTQLGLKFNLFNLKITFL